MSRLFSSVSFILLLTLYLTGCTSLYRVSNVRIEVLQPARFEMPDSVQNIAIINRLPMLNDTLIHQEVRLSPDWKSFTTYPFTTYHSDLYISIVKDILERSGRFQQIVEINETVLNDSDSLLIRPLRTEDIDKIIKLNPELDYLLFFDLLTNDELTVFMSGFNQYRMELLIGTLWQIAATNTNKPAYYYNKTDTLIVSIR